VPIKSTASKIIKQSYGNNPPKYTADIVKSAAYIIRKQSASQMRKHCKNKSVKAKHYRKLLFYAVRSCWGKGVIMV